MINDNELCLKTKISLDFVIENNISNKNSNPYIAHLCAQSNLISTFYSHANTNYNVRQLLNHRHLKKEITELYGALVFMEKALKKKTLSSSSSSSSESSESSESLSESSLDDLLSFNNLRSLGTRLIIYDLCSGKGLASFFLSFMFPLATIRMIDFEKKIKLGHLTVLSNVNYQYLDIYSDQFLQVISSIS